MEALKRVGRRDDVADVIAFFAFDGAAGLQGRASRWTADRSLKGKVLPRRKNSMNPTKQEKNKALVFEAFDTLFNKRDYASAQRY